MRSFAKRNLSESESNSFNNEIFLSLGSTKKLRETQNSCKYCVSGKTCFEEKLILVEM